MLFFKLRLTLLISRSQNPPHFSTINFQDIRQLLRNLVTSTDRAIFTISLDAALKVFALSEISVAGKPLRLVNWRNNRRNEGTDKSRLSSRCTARVEQQVKRHIIISL